MNISEFRNKYPQYNDISDNELADKLYSKHYSDMPRQEFDSSFLGTKVEQPQSEASQVGTKEVKTPETFGEFIEPMVTMGTAAIAEPIAGIAGAIQSLNPFASEGAGARAVEKTREALTYSPKSEVGTQTLQELGGLIEPVAEAMQKPANYVFEKTGSPFAATIVASTPTAIMELFALKGLKGIRPGVELVNDAGRPTKVLREQLNKHGLDFDSLSTEAKAKIPKKVDPKLMMGDPVSPEVEKILARQIKSGAREDKLAGLKAVGEKVVTDPIGTEAMKQGFRPGFVQSVKTASPQTKAKMREMTNIMRRIKKNERLGMEMRPSDVIGDSVSERIRFIRGSADDARMQLDKIAKTKLQGMDVDTAPVINTLEKALSDLDVSIVRGNGGLPSPNFKGSLISKDRSSQRVIRDLFDILAEGGKPDALRFHKVKRQLDIMIDFNKKSAIGLSDAGKKVLKNIRYSINESIRGASREYATVNDTLSKAITTLEDFDSAVGTIDIFGKGSEKAIGQKLRALMSNQQGRVSLENALDGLTETTKDFGGAANIDIKDLVMFSDALNEKFGTTARTSFAGQVEQAVTQAAKKPVRETVIEKGVEKLGKGLESLRGINDEKAFSALYKLTNN